MVDLCPTCGAIKPQAQLFPRSPCKQAIFDYIRTHPGCNMTNILDCVYGHAPNGGPGLNTIAVHITGMRPHLRQQGIDITSIKGRGGASYHVVQLKAQQ